MILYCVYHIIKIEMFENGKNENDIGGKKYTLKQLSYSVNCTKVFFQNLFKTQNIHIIELYDINVSINYIKYIIKIFNMNSYIIQEFKVKVKRPFIEDKNDMNKGYKVIEYDELYKSKYGDITNIVPGSISENTYQNI